VFEDYEESPEYIQYRMLLEQAHHAGGHQLQQLYYQDLPSDPSDLTSSQTLPYGIQMVQSPDLCNLGVIG
jgi:hypothetical protein